MLEAGFPVSLENTYAVLVAVNAASVVAAILRGNRHSALAEVLVDSVYVVARASVEPAVDGACCRF